MNDPNAAKRFFTKQFHARWRHLAAVGAHFGLALGLTQLAWAQDPIITQQPANKTVIVGYSVIFVVRATTTNGPLSIQWQRDDPSITPVTFTNMPNAGRLSLSLHNVTLDQTGDYRVIVANAAGDSVISDVAHLDVIPAPFTRVTSGPVVTKKLTQSMSAAWGDINQDGFEDLIISSLGSVDWDRAQVTAREAPCVFINNQDGTFRRASEMDIGPLAASKTASGMAVLADYDNDGYLDFYQNAWFETCRLWRGGPDGKFTLVTDEIGPNVHFNGEGTWGYSWADFNCDGFLDLYVTTAWSSFGGTSDFLFSNRGNGTFATVDLGRGGESQYPCWADYDNDGDPDVFVGWRGFYRNEGGGQFSEVTSLLSGGGGFYGAWADYDWDGDLDLITLTGLYENNGAGSFTKREGTKYPAAGLGSWADIDNDGRLELYLGDYNTWRRRLYRYNPATKDFSEFSDGVLTADSMANANLAWADYNNDGFIDLLVCSGDGSPNRLYRNNGNANHWLQVKLVGRASNRSGIGARVIAETAVFGKPLRQMHEMNAIPMASIGRAQFGLGNATKVDTLRIEWPSGIVQELKDVAVNQLLEVVESQAVPMLEPLVIQECSPRSTSMCCSVDGVCCVLETSVDLEHWSKFKVQTSAAGQVKFNYYDPSRTSTRFFRVLVP